MEQNILLLDEKNIPVNDDAPGETDRVIDHVKTENTNQNSVVDLFEEDLYVWSLLLLVDKT